LTDPPVQQLDRPTGERGQCNVAQFHAKHLNYAVVYRVGQIK